MLHTATIVDIDISIVFFMSKPMCPLNCSFVYFNPAEPAARHAGGASQLAARQPRFVEASVSRYGDSGIFET